MISWFPSEIEELIEKWEPYGQQIYNEDLQNVPEEAIEAYKVCKEWVWNQGQ